MRGGWCRAKRQEKFEARAKMRTGRRLWLKMGGGSLNEVFWEGHSRICNAHGTSCSGLDRDTWGDNITAVRCGAHRLYWLRVDKCTWHCQRVKREGLVHATATSLPGCRVLLPSTMRCLVSRLIDGPVRASSCEEARRNMKRKVGTTVLYEGSIGGSPKICSIPLDRAPVHRDQSKS
jgi:hypothetical protein